MDVKDAYAGLSALLDDFLHPLGMNTHRGPLRAMGDLVRGILWTGSVQLTNAARLLRDEPAGLSHEVDRLSFYLSDRDWNHHEWAAAVLQTLSDMVGQDDLVPIDGTDIAKPYARTMQWQCTIQDASRRHKPLVQGYWCFGAHGWNPQGQRLTSLMLRPWSQEMPDFMSENALWNRWMWSLRQATAGRGIWLMDRGFDRPAVLATLLRIQKRWIMRLRADRGLIGPDGSRRCAEAWAQIALASRPQRGAAVTLPVKLPREDVSQSPAPPPLWLVVPTYSFGQNQRWYLLTCGLVGQHTGPRQVRHDYALRWRAEDAKRLLGQVWHVERFLTRSFIALERILVCVSLASGFISRIQTEEPTLAQWLAEQIIRLPDDEPEILAYRIARGLLIVAGKQTGVSTMTVNA